MEGDLSDFPVTVTENFVRLYEDYRLLVLAPTAPVTMRPY